MTRRREPHPDLFGAFTAPTIVEQFAPERVRATSCSARIKRAAAEAIHDCSMGRKAIAQAMSDFLGEPVTAAMLDQYTSPAAESHNISAHRLVALLVVTGDVRLMNGALHDTGVIAVSAKYEPLIRREMAKEARDRLDRQIDAADAQWRVNK